MAYTISSIEPVSVGVNRPRPATLSALAMVAAAAVVAIWAAFAAGVPQLLASVSWGSVSWGASVSWGSVSWGSVSWG